MSAEGLLQPEELPQHVGQAASRDRRQAWARNAVAKLWQFAAGHRDASREDLGVALGLAGADIVTGPDIDAGDELPAALALLAAAVLGSVPVPDGRPWRFDVPAVPPRVTCIQDHGGGVWVREGSRWADFYNDDYRVDVVDLLGHAPLVEHEDPRAAS